MSHDPPAACESPIREPVIQDERRVLKCEECAAVDGAEGNERACRRGERDQIVGGVAGVTDLVEVTVDENLDETMRRRDDSDVGEVSVVIVLSPPRES